MTASCTAVTSKYVHRQCENSTSNDGVNTAWSYDQRPLSYFHPYFWPFDLTTPIFELGLHFDVNYTPVKVCDCVLNGCYHVDKICPQTDWLINTWQSSPNHSGLGWCECLEHVRHCGKCVLWWGPVPGLTTELAFLTSLLSLLASSALMPLRNHTTAKSRAQWLLRTGKDLQRHVALSLPEQGVSVF